MVNLNNKLLFTQGVFQDYVDCKRRFFLKYVQGLAWPAIQAEPVVERALHIQRGEQFHRAVHQYFVGIPVEKIRTGLIHPELNRWWNNFMLFWERNYASTLQDVTASHYIPEYAFSSELAGVRLGIKYDLVFHNDQHELVIFDWKTSNHRPNRNWLAIRMQTRLYQYLGVQVGRCLYPEMDFVPAQIQLIYWFSEFPDQSEFLGYNDRQYQLDEAFFNRLINEINESKDTDFLMTNEIRYCQFCNFRSFCNRGHVAGNFLGGDTDDNVDESDRELIDFTNVEEIPVLL